ncbi:uncharacterized protein LOC129597511 isoform X2 [Paramacrobiotus metropolitanus]|uniref:uncharacterized protein LOC129597511 isoform X2 n=1 Tax=Paramacrobiotus metropolitanus TaxID=2943436 RepID=UPI00244646C9|nr:uncharacterized protein LOC129597511 isoform X2 [Paramacrobiotus metropolitanus]
MIRLLGPIILILHCQRVAAIVCYECTTSSPSTPQHLCPSKYNEQQNISALPKTTCTRTNYCAEVSYQTESEKRFKGKNCLGSNGRTVKWIIQPQDAK